MCKIGWSGCLPGRLCILSGCLLAHQAKIVPPTRSCPSFNVSLWNFLHLFYCPLNLCFSAIIIMKLTAVSFNWHTCTVAHTQTTRLHCESLSGLWCLTQVRWFNYLQKWNFSKDFFSSASSFSSPCSHRWSTHLSKSQDQMEETTQTLKQ